MSSFSENEDEPAAYESSGTEWDEESEIRPNKRRISQRLSKKPRLTHTESSDSEDEIEEKKRKVKNGVNKRQTTTSNIQTYPETKTSPISQRVVFNASFTPGTFVIAKRDAQSGDMSNPPCIWKIDGKALLQKYEPFEYDGKVRHRNTSIYTGWSALDKDLYAPIKVRICLHSNQRMEVEINWDDLKAIDVDSD